MFFGTTANHTDNNLRKIIGYSDVNIVVFSQPTVAYRQNQIGINTENFGEIEKTTGLVVQNKGKNDKNIIILRDIEEGQEILIDIYKRTFENIVIDCGK